MNNQTFQLSQFLIDRTTSAYSNLLTINQTLQQLRGFYRFAAVSGQTGTNQSRSGPNVTTGKGEFSIQLKKTLLDPPCYQALNVLLRVSRSFTLPALVHKTHPHAASMYIIKPHPFSLSTFAVQHFFGMYIVGDSESVTCTITNATRIEWLHNGSVVHSGTGSQLTIQISVNDSIHHNLYTCRGYSGVSILNSLNVTTIVNGM